MIFIYTTQDEIKNHLKEIPKNTIGFVPTMGNLHEGHLSLISQSLKNNQTTVVSIFVNPKQFGPNEDFLKYPRTLETDIALIKKLDDSSKEILIFAPKTNQEIYPENFNTVISVKKITESLEGKLRPSHFDGVTTVVYQLFHLINPTNAYFGQKDYQQCLVIKKMVSDLDLFVIIHIQPIIRSSEGLALSSRNQYLTPEDKIAALYLPQTLRKIEMLIRNKSDYKALIASLLTDQKWDYLEVLDANNLEDPSSKTQEVVVIGAYKLGTTRLLDNILVTFVNNLPVKKL